MELKSVEMAFHFDPDKKGRNVELTNGRTSAVVKNVRDGWKGVVTKEALRPGEVFSVRLDRFDNSFMFPGAIVSERVRCDWERRYMCL